MYSAGIYSQRHTSRPMPVTCRREHCFDARYLQLATQATGAIQVDNVRHVISIDCHRLNCLRPAIGAPPTYLGSLMRFCYCRRD